MRVNRIKFAAALARADMKCNELAKKSGISRSTVTSVKSGKSCSKETAEKLSAILGPDILEKEE